MLAVAGQPIPLESSFDPGLSFVAAEVKDVTAGHPGILVDTIPMVESEAGVSGTYGCNFDGTAYRSYLATKNVYTDGTYTTRHPDYSPSSVAFQVIAAQASPPPSNSNTSFLIGEVLTSDPVLGEVGPVPVVGIVTEDE